MSGGVDSSVATSLLQEKGYEIEGVYLRLWQEEGKKEDSAAKDAQKVASILGIPFQVWDLRQEFKEEIVDYFLTEYGQGQTPNPCVVCNRKIKFGYLLDKALALGFDGVASGHYLRRVNWHGEERLYKAKDKHKDQSYFLYSLSQEQLSRLYFPLFKYSKDEVRKMAKERNLPVFSKSESQDICFISGSTRDFLKQRLKLVPGNIKREKDNKVIGQHQGLPLYTLGQRKGIEVGGSGPYYVSRLDYKNNILWVVGDGDDSSLKKEEFLIKDYNWISKTTPKLPLSCQVVIRYNNKANLCSVHLSNKKGRLKVVLNKATRAVTPGQSAVFYKGKRVLGGGVIDS